MNTVQYSHPHSGKRSSSKLLATTDKMLTGSGFAADAGRFDIQLGHAATSDDTATRNIGVDMNEAEALALRNKLTDFLYWCVEKRLEAAQRQLQKDLAK